MKKTTAQNERSGSVERRQFIKAGTMLGLGSFLIPHSLIGRSSLAPTIAGDCLPTTDDIMGPF